MTLHIAAPVVHDEGDHITIESVLTYRDISPTLWFRLPSQFAPDATATGDGLLASMLPMAMARGYDITVDAPVSAKLLDGIDHIQSIYTSWYPKKMKRVAITAEAAEESAPAREATISCFTGGVDSFYTLVRNRDSLDSLLYVDGFDIPLADRALLRKTHEHLDSVGDQAGLSVLTASTNVRTFTNPVNDWGLHAHGAALASIGLLLQPHFSRFLIPSSHSYAQMFPWASHVVLDHLWSTERLTVIHDGAQASRVEKTVAIATEPAAYDNLRVCFKKKGPYNCGRCEKCLRTMTALELAGTLDRFAVFPDPLTPESLRDLTIADDNQLGFQYENLEYARTIDRTSPLALAMRSSIHRYRKERDEAAALKGTAPVPPPEPAIVIELRKLIDAQNTKAANLERELKATSARAARLADVAKATRLRTAQLERDQQATSAQVESTSARLRAVERALPIRIWRALSRAVRRIVPRR